MKGDELTRLSSKYLGQTSYPSYVLKTFSNLPRTHRPVGFLINHITRSVGFVIIPHGYYFRAALLAKNHQARRIKKERERETAQTKRHSRFTVRLHNEYHLTHKNISNHTNVKKTHLHNYMVQQQPPLNNMPRRNSWNERRSRGSTNDKIARIIMQSKNGNGGRGGQVWASFFWVLIFLWRYS